jgi:hypothetical protein
MIKRVENAATLLVMAGLVGAANARAMDASTDGIEDAVPNYRPFTLSAEAGSIGIGGTVRWRFLNHLGVGAGFNTLGVSFNAEGDGLDLDANIRLQAAPITLDVYPFKTQSFRISAGVAFNGNEISSRRTFTEDQEIGDNIYTPAEIGTLSLDVDLGDEVVPYLGIGGVLIYIDKAHRWSMGWDAGVMLTGSPDITLASDRASAALVADLEKERQSFKDRLKAFKVWPVGKIAVSFSF